MAKRKSIEDRARAWAKKWADYNHPELAANADHPEKVRASESAMWIGWFTGGCKGWWHGYQAALRDMRRR